MLQAEHADLSRSVRAAQTRSALAAIAASHAFVPLLSVWGAALLALCFLALPGDISARVAAATGLALPASTMRLLLAGALAVFGGLLGLAAARAIRGRVATDKTDAGSEPLPSDVIDPARELGSDSLDAPLLGKEPRDTEIADGQTKSTRAPTLGELAERDYEDEPVLADEGGERKAAQGPSFTRRHFRDALIESCEERREDTSQPAVDVALPQAELGVPRELDLAAFGDLPGRNGVWLEEPVAQDEPSLANAPAIPIAAVPISQSAAEPAPSALDLLRARPTADLSLVEMVERFAGALHEYQTRAHADPATAQDGSDEALARSLRALDLFTAGRFEAQGDVGAEPTAEPDSPAERELREALIKLQSLRGVA
jgi:hypothetical protein